MSSRAPTAHAPAPAPEPDAAPHPASASGALPAAVRAAVIDPARVAAVRATALLDTEAEATFDRLSRLAVRLAGVPAAFLSLVDAERDFYKSACGFGEPLATARELTGPTFCHYAIASPGPLVIPDTAADPLYRDVPTVRTLGVAAYVGVPVAVNGQRVGSFCAIDTRPRAWTAAEVEVLTELAASAERELELRARQAELERANQQLREQAAELEAQAEELHATAAHLEEQTEAAEAARQQAEAERTRAEGVLESMADAYFALDADFRIVAVNEAMVRNTGLAREAVVGRSMWDAFPGTVGTVFERHYRAAVADGAEAHFTHDYADARLDLVTDVDVYPGPIGADGRRGVAVFWRDVTARARAEAALAAGDARYRALLASLDTGFCVIEVLFDDAGRAADYRFLETNATFERQSGLRDMVGRRIREVAPDHEAHWFATYGRVAQEGRPARLEAHAEALGRWFDVFAYRVDAPEQRRVAVLFTDVTPAKAAARERERLLADARESEARFRNVADAAPVMLWVTDAEGRCTFLNRAWLEFTGQTLDEGLGHGWLDVVHPDDAAESARAFREAAGRSAPFQLDYRVRRRDGVYRRAVDAAPRVDPDGTFRGYVGSVVDVEERAALLDAERAARAEAEAARGAAEEANQAKAEFLATMSHELRTPLNAIGGYAELLELGIRGPVTPDQRADLEKIRRAQRHLLGLINGVLNYARVEAGAVHYDLADVPLDEVLATCEALVAPQARAKGLTLRRAPSPEPLRARADREKVQQVVLNLLSNAVKFTEPGGRVGVSAGRAGDAVQIAVTDTGVGIPADQLARAFEPFVQVDAALTRTQEGTGLGLAISRDLARGMGGDLTAESAVGRGSTFTLTLPAAE